MNKCILSLAALALIGLSARASLLFQDSNNYADDAAMRSVYKTNTSLTSDTAFTYSASGLSFANHFASAGGAQYNATSNQRSIAALDSTVQLTGAFGENEWNGETITFYSSFLINASTIPNWAEGSRGATLLTNNSDQTGYGSGIGQTDPDTDDFTTSLAPGGRVDANSWTNMNSNTFQGTTTISINTTYLVLAKFEYTNPNLATYNPFTATGSIRGQYALLTESDPYPTSEAEVSWEIDQTVVNVTGANQVLSYAGYSSNAGGGVFYDELRVGTEFGDVMVIPEPGTLALVGLALGSMLLFRRRS